MQECHLVLASPGSDTCVHYHYSYYPFFPNYGNSHGWSRWVYLSVVCLRYRSVVLVPVRFTGEVWV